MHVAATQLARKRIARGLTQRELARRLGIHPATLSSVENGWRVAWPKLRADCARVLRYSEQTLFPVDERPRR